MRKDSEAPAVAFQARDFAHLMQQLPCAPRLTDSNAWSQTLSRSSNLCGGEGEGKGKGKSEGGEWRGVAEEEEEEEEEEEDGGRDVNDDEDDGGGECDDCNYDSNSKIQDFRKRQ